MTKPPRICYVTPAYPSGARPDLGFPLFDICRRLVVPSLILARVNGDDPAPAPPHATLRAIAVRDVVLADRAGWALRTATAGKGLGYAAFLAQGAPGLVRFRPTAVHIDTLMPILHGLFARHVLGAQLSISIVGNDLIYLERSRALQALTARADVLLPVSAHMVPFLSSIAPNARILVAPAAVDRATFHPRALNRTSEVLMAAAFRWEKAHDTMLHAFRQVVDRLPNARLALAGAGYMEGRVRRQVTDLGLERSVAFLGHLTPADLARRMNTSVACVLSSRHEGSPRVLMESIACGTPVVATRVGGCEAVVQRAGLLVPPDDPTALAGAIATMIENRAVWRQCADACARRAVDFDLSRRAKMYADALGANDALGRDF